MLRITTSTLIFVALLICTISYGQISITSNDLLGLVGSSFLIEEDSSENIAVDVGEAGVNRTWDLSGTILQNPFMLQQEFLTEIGTPFEANFPSANLVNKITSPDFPEGGIYQYLEINPTSARQLGNGSSFTDMGMTFTFVNEFDELIAPLPVNYGDSWTFVFRDTTEEAGIFTNFVYDSTITVVDGWGTVRLPGGDFDCLRLFERSFTSGDTYINGVLSGSFAEEDISYIWVSKNNFLLATITSEEGEINPNFTNASSFNRLVNGISPAHDLINANLNLEIVGANPVIDHTFIQFELEGKTNVDLHIRDMSGRRIKTLVKGVVSGGVHEVLWNGLSDGASTTGTYLVVLQTSHGKMAKKLHLLR